MSPTHIDWQHVLTGIGLALLLEGVPYFLWAERMPSFLRFMASRSTAELRRLGLVAMLAGLLVVYIAQS